MYPSIILENNIAPNTQIGRIIIDETVYKGENAYNNPKYSRGGEFIENMVTDNHIEFCKRWFHLAGFKEILQDMQEYYQKFYVSYSSYGRYEPYYINDNKLIVVPVRDMGTKKAIKPIRFSDKPYKPLHFLNERDMEVHR